jgi:hypothetical protein
VQRYIEKFRGGEMKRRATETLQIKGKNDEKYAEICRNMQECMELKTSKK